MTNFISRRNSMLWLLTLPMLILFACARQGSPTGGPKDTTPPKVDSLKSTPNYSVRFNQKEIKLYFDEWVILNDVGNQVLISPPLNHRPAITLKDKAVVVEIDKQDTLRSNTTYTINFGNAVKDLHEGNIAKDLRFVFSTGDFIDSLVVKGMVADAFTGDPVENISVLLYDKMSDSIIRQEKPYYFTKTDKTGVFTIRNVKPGNFKVVAIDDTDQTLKWDGQNERIAFLQDAISSTDTNATHLSLRLFKNQGRLRKLENNDSRYGLVKVIYSGQADTLPVSILADSIRTFRETSGDTVLVWYDKALKSAWEFSAGTDTIRVKAQDRTAFLENYRLKPGTEEAPKNAGRRNNNTVPPINPTAVTPGTPAPPVNPPKIVAQNPGKRMVLSFSAPITALDTTKWEFKLDSTILHYFTPEVNSKNHRQIAVSNDWKAGKTYNLLLFPGAVTDFFGVSNVDTLHYIINVSSDRQLGGLNLTLKLLKPGTNYVVQLLNGSNIEEERRFMATKEEQKLEFRNLPAAAYLIRVIEDNNANGRWDAGAYFRHKQPEKVFSKKLEALRANWELEAALNLRD